MAKNRGFLKFWGRQKFFSKKIFFVPKFSKNLYFWPFLAKKSTQLASTPRWVKVHMSMMAQKNRNKKCQKRVQKFFSKKIFFDPKFSKNLYFWPFLVKNSINLVSLQCSIGVGMHVMAQNDHNTILLKWVKKISKFLPPKIQKIDFLGPKMAKNDQKIEKFSKKFFWSESI